MARKEKIWKIYRYWIIIAGEEWNYVGRTHLPYQCQRCGNLKTGSGYFKLSKFGSAIKKYGWENFHYEVLCETTDEEESYTLEKMTIELLNSVEHGFNTSLGGKGGNTGVIPSLETRKKRSEALSGEKHPMFGKHHTEEAKRKNAEAHKGKPAWNRKRVNQYTLDGEYLNTFLSTYDAAKQTGCSQSHISCCCNGKENQAGGYKWLWDTNYV